MDKKTTDQTTLMAKSVESNENLSIKKDEINFNMSHRTSPTILAHFEYFDRKKVTQTQQSITISGGGDLVITTSGYRQGCREKMAQKTRVFLQNNNQIFFWSQSKYIESA